MEKLVFGDGEKIGVFDGEKVKKFDSEQICRYREYAENRTKKDEWKYAGEGARFRGDYERYESRKEKIYAYIDGVQWDGDKVIYSYTVNGCAGVMRKPLNEKEREEHILSLNDESVLSLHRRGNELAVTVESDGITSRIGVLNQISAELKTLTDGDSRDANARFDGGNGILFDSAGVGRNSNGEFTGKYAPAAICRLNVDTMEIEELLKNPKYSFVKPRVGADGTLYCIRRPAKEKKNGNLFLDILLFPYRILQAIVMFVQMFVMMFTGKSLLSEGSNPAKGRETDSRKLFVDGNLINVEKECKRNRKKKDKEYGFIPLSWKLIAVKGEKQEEIKSGVCDFDICEDGGIYCTNGRRIFYIKDGKTEKAADTERCLCLAAAHTYEEETDLFSI